MWPLTLKCFDACVRLMSSPFLSTLTPALVERIIQTLNTLYKTATVQKDNNLFLIGLNDELTSKIKLVLTAIMGR